MQIRAYPNRDYSCHGELQRKISQHAALQERVFILCFLGGVGSFLGMIVTSYIGIDIVTKGLAIILGIMLVLMFLTGLYTPRQKCPTCNSRMKHQYVSRPRGPGEDLFIICHPCKIYADTHSGRE